MEGRQDDLPATSKPESSDLFSSTTAQVRLPNMAPKTGNAFSQRQERERQRLQSTDEREKRKSIHEAVAIPLIGPEATRKPPKMATRGSNLDLSADLALPMPKTRPPDSQHPAFRDRDRDEPTPKAKPEDFKSRSFTDPGSNQNTPRHTSAVPKPLFSEKKSKIAMLKSKFSIENMGGGKKKKSAEKDGNTPTTPLSAVSVCTPEEKVFRTSSRDGDSAGAGTGFGVRPPPPDRMPSIPDHDSRSPTLNNEDGPEQQSAATATPSKPKPQTLPQLEDVELLVQKSPGNPEGRFYKKYGHLVVDEPRVPVQSSPLGSAELSHFNISDDGHKSEGMGMGDQVGVPTDKPSISNMHGGYAHPAWFENHQEKPEGHKAEQPHSRQNSAEGESVYESVVSNRSSVENSQVRAWELMQSTQPNTMPEFTSMHVPTPIYTVDGIGAATTTGPEPQAKKTKKSPTWPFIVSSTRPKPAIKPTPVSSTAQNVGVSAPSVTQNVTFQQDACMFTLPANDARRSFRHPSQDGISFTGPAPELGAYVSAPPPPPPNFQPFVAPTTSVLQPIHHHLDEHGRNIGFQIASTRDYLLDQVMRRLNVIEDDMGALRQHLLLQNAQVEEVRSQMVRVSNEVVKGSEGVKATEKRLVEHISELKGITELLSAGAVEASAVSVAPGPVHKESLQAVSVKEVVSASKKVEGEGVNSTAVDVNPSQQNTSKAAGAETQSPALEDVPTPTAAYRTPSVKGKEATESGSSSENQSVVKQSERKEDEDVFVDSPEQGEDARRRSNAALRINTSIPSDSATAAVMTTVSERSSENNDLTTTTSSATTDTHNTPRRRPFWPRGVKTPHSRGHGPNTGPARFEQQAPPPSHSGTPAMSRTASDISQTSIHPAFRTGNNMQRTPHRDMDREHQRNWFQSASRSRPGSYTGSSVGYNNGPPQTQNTPFRGHQNRGTGYESHNYHHGNNRNNNNHHTPHFGRGNRNRRGSSGTFSTTSSNNPAITGSNPYNHQQRVLRPEYMYDPTWVPGTYPYNNNNNQQPHHYPHPHGPHPPHNQQPFGGGDGNASATGSYQGSAASGEFPTMTSWGWGSWYEQAYGRTS